MRTMLSSSHLLVFPQPFTTPLKRHRITTTTTLKPYTHSLPYKLPSPVTVRPSPLVSLYSNNREGLDTVNIAEDVTQQLTIAMASKLLWQRRVFRSLQNSLSSSPRLLSSSIHRPRVLFVHTSEVLRLSAHNSLIPALASSRSLCSSSSNLADESHGPTAIDYRSVLQEGEFHKLADSTIHSLQEKLEDYGDSVEVDGFDIDYGNDVLTIKLGDLGTYVLNKQTPNRQLWLSSPVSGPSRFDWDQDSKAWIYRRTKTNLCKILESELGELCGKPLVFT